MNEVKVDIVYDHVKEEVEEDSNWIETPGALEVMLAVGRKEGGRTDEGAGR